VSKSTQAWETTVSQEESTGRVASPGESPPDALPRLSALLEVLESAWRLLAERHPELPGVAFVVESGPAPFPVRPCGHWTADRWSLPSGERVGELRIPAEHLQQGASAVLELLLHEAAHVLAHVRSVREVSRQGRYHNKRYSLLARELGLSVERDETAGFHQTKLPRRARARYTDVLAQLEKGLADYLERSKGHEGQHEGGAGWAPRRDDEPPQHVGGGEGRLLLLCACHPPRKLRVSRSTFEQGAITCGLCGLAFGPRLPAEFGAKGVGST
jgi:hypothetical protein